MAYLSNTQYWELRQLTPSDPSLPKVWSQRLTFLTVPLNKERGVNDYFVFETDNPSKFEIFIEIQNDVADVNSDTKHLVDYFQNIIYEHVTQCNNDLKIEYKVEQHHQHHQHQDTPNLVKTWECNRREHKTYIKFRFHLKSITKCANPARELLKEMIIIPEYHYIEEKGVRIGFILESLITR